MHLIVCRQQFISIPHNYVFISLIRSDVLPTGQISSMLTRLKGQPTIDHESLLFRELIDVSADL